MNDAQLKRVLRELIGAEAPPVPGTERAGDRRVIIFIAAGCFLVLGAIIAAMAFGGASLPDWSESLFSAVAGGLVVKLADCLSALVALSSSRTSERLGMQLAASTPSDTPRQVEVVNPPGKPVPVEDRQ